MDTFDQILNLLQQAVACDRNAMDELCGLRVPCNDALAEHPTIQVSGMQGEPTVVGTIGIVNGICELLTGKRVAANYDESGNLIGFIEYKG